MGSRGEMGGVGWAGAGKKKEDWSTWRRETAAAAVAVD